MTLYLTDHTDPAEVALARASGRIAGFKLYPAGATTHSQSGVTDLRHIRRVLEQISQHNMVLQVHGEVTGSEVDVFDREARFIDEVLLPLCVRHPGLRIVFEHITTRRAVEFVRSARTGVVATITPQHLMMNRNALFVGGIRPHLYCLPVLKTEGRSGGLDRGRHQRRSAVFPSVPTAHRMRAIPRRRPAAAPASSAPMPPSSCTRKSSIVWAGCRCCPASRQNSAPTSMVCRAIRTSSRWSRIPGKSLTSMTLAARRWCPCERAR